MIYTLDTEFHDTGRHKPIALISLGIQAEDGRTWYGVNGGFDWTQFGPNEWLVQNVQPKLNVTPKNIMSIDEMKQSLIKFFAHDMQPEFWGYYADWDWLLFLHIFGTMLDGPPKTFPHLCLDVAQYRKHLGLAKEVFPRPDPKREHNALYDAQWTMEYLGICKVHHAAQLARMGLGRV